MTFLRPAPVLFAILALTSLRANATELILDGTFTTTPILGAGTYTADVGRTGSGATYIMSGTAGTAGWFTSEGDARFEVWTPGFMGSPTGVGNTLELANTSGGQTISQSVTSGATGSTAIFSFGYATRDNGNDKFTVTITDTTHTATLFTQQFNPTGSFATNTTFSKSLAITPGDAYTVAFLDQNTAGNGGTSTTTSAHIDNVSFQQVPEPGACLFLAAGAGFAIVASKRRLFKSATAA